MNKFKILIITFILLLTFIIPIPKYIELNNLAIINNIYITCNNNYEIYLKEIIPLKENNSIKYQYKIHKESNTNLKDIYLKIKKSKTNYYINKTKYIKTNCKNKKEIEKTFNKKVKIEDINKINKELSNP